MACLFGSRLASVADVTLLGTWSEGIEAIRESGVIVDSGAVAKAVRVRAGYLEDPVEPADLVLVLAKARQTQRIARRLPFLLKSDAIALTLQNGLGNLELLGPRGCLGVTTQGATLVGPGRVRPGGDATTRMVAPDWVLEIFERAGFDACRCDPGETAGLLWSKLTANCGINALTALLRITNGDLLARPDALIVLDLAANECAAVARAKGISLPFVDPAAWTRHIASRTALNRSSMLQDVLRGAPTEIDAINGALVREGTLLGVPTPVNEILWRLVRALAPGATRETSLVC